VPSFTPEVAEPGFVRAQIAQIIDDRILTCANCRKRWIPDVNIDEAARRLDDGA
jgi:hypothetical protein